jgi:hypothetical protein
VILRLGAFMNGRDVERRVATGCLASPRLVQRLEGDPGMRKLRKAALVLETVKDFCVRYRRCAGIMLRRGTRPFFLILRSPAQQGVSKDRGPSVSAWKCLGLALRDASLRRSRSKNGVASLAYRSSR